MAMELRRVAGNYVRATAIAIFGHNFAPFAFQELRFGFIVINMVSNTFISRLSV